MKFGKLLFSSIIISSFFTFGCSSNNTKLSSYYAEGIDSFIHLDSNGAIDLVNNKQDFILFLYSDCGCGGSTDSVIETFKMFIEETNLIIYAIGSTNYKKLPVSMKDTFPLFPTDANKQINDIPTLYFYNNGSLVKTYTYNSNFKSIDGINDIIYNNVEKNGVTILNKYISFTYEDTYDFYLFDYSDTSILDEKISNEKLTILYSWNKCNDCNSLKSIIKDYLKENNKKLYFFEVDYFRNPNNKSTLWDDQEFGFPYKYQFSSYRGGKVPAIVSYNEKEATDYIIYHNDVVANGTIQESFFEELIGRSISEEEQENYHKEKIIEFLNNMEN